MQDIEMGLSKLIREKTYLNYVDEINLIDDFKQYFKDTSISELCVEDFVESTTNKDISKDILVNLFNTYFFNKFKPKEQNR
ncbi:MAG: hypothetical protein COA63_013990 [Methylophaga sp.]|nr:hypothetical protein [Methylophaga sp.]